MSTIYTVYGDTGEHGDYKSWPVAHFTSKKRAETWARRCNEFAVENELSPGNAGDWMSPPNNPYDRQMQVDYTGTEYGVGSGDLNPPLPTLK